ncbi:MAG: 50S ribosomal protein L9 [Myxococcota bacterium]|nr:50S ribosomal protein L9 [Myxococcota bacterium]
MKVILQQEVPKIGALGEVVEVSDGYARNYLIPRGMAVLAHSRNVGQLRHAQGVAQAKKDRFLSEAQASAAKLEGVAVTIRRQADEEGEKLFGSVTNRDIAEALAAEGIEVDRRAIELSEPIKSLGAHTVSIGLFADVSAEVKVYVVKE